MATVNSYTPIQNMRLTRYLYNKDDVFASIFLSILEKDYEKAVFWVSEIYHSGWETSYVADFLVSIYNDLFSHHPMLGKYLNKMVTRSEEGAHIVATMVRNLTAKHYIPNIQGFIKKINDEPDDAPMPDSNPTKLFITVRPEDLLTEPDIDEPARKRFRKLCKYATRKDARDFFDYKYNDVEYIYHWLYYASFTPVWENRILEYGGVVDHEKREVAFSHEDLAEEFYVKYDYDIDEQPLEIQRRIAMLENVKQMGVDEICCNII